MSDAEKINTHIPRDYPSAGALINQISQEFPGELGASEGDQQQKLEAMMRRVEELKPPLKLGEIIAEVHEVDKGLSDGTKAQPRLRDELEDRPRLGDGFRDQPRLRDELEDQPRLGS